jgi:phage baseplate assembly protein W
MASTIYRGFSTYNRFKKFRLSDFELAKQDLFNHLNIRKGEKLMNPNFGTIIWGLLFEPLTPEVKTIISNDLSTIVGYDPRLQTENITVSEYEHGIQVMLELRFVETNQVDQMRLQFDKSSI